MKPALFSAGILSLLALTGCNTTTNTPAQQPQPPAETAPEQPKQPEQPEQTQNTNPANLPAPTEWRSLYLNKQNTDIKEMFDKAYQLVATQKGVTGELNPWSCYFGQWVIVEIKHKIDPEMIALDAPQPTDPAFLVDMAAEKVIDMGDWKTAKPFFDAQADAVKRGFENDHKRLSFIARMAASASVVGFGNTRYVEDPGDIGSSHKNISGPTFKHDMNKSELVYFISSTGMYRFFTKCTLTIGQNTIIYNSEIIPTND